MLSLNLMNVTLLSVSLVLSLEHGHSTIRLPGTTWSVSSWPWLIFHGFLCLVAHVHQFTNISLPHSLSMFRIEVILQNVEVDHLSPIVVVVLFIEGDQFISFLPRNFHFLRNFFLFLRLGWVGDTFHYVMII